MATSRDGPNPLRPYSLPHNSQPLPQPKQKNASSAGEPRRATRASAASNLGSSARNMLSDLDYSDYLNEASPSLTEVLKNLADQGLWKYTSVLLAQPFDVAKTVLQVQLASAVEEAKGLQKRPEQPLRKGSRQVYDYDEEDSGDDSASYFTSAAPLSPRTPRTPRVNRRHFASRSPSPEASSVSSRGRTGASRQGSSAHTIALKSTSSLTAVLSYLWQTEGAWGVWKGTNSTFIHNVLLSSLTTFLRSLLCAVLALPDPSSPATSSAVPGGLDIISSPSPLLSLFATTAASALAAVILAPVDIARTRLMLTPSTHPPRTLPSTLKSLRSWTLPANLAPATILHGCLPTLISASTPLFCRSRFGIDPVLTPTSYAVATFSSQALEIAVRMPVETVLRRGQIAFVNEQETPLQVARSGRPSKQTPVETVVPVGSYRGLVGTMFHVSFEEGERTSKAELAKEGLARATGKADAVRPQQQRRRKGQGIEGLYRGWRVGAWGLLGVYAAAMLGGPGKGGEF